MNSGTRDADENRRTKGALIYFRDVAGMIALSFVLTAIPSQAQKVGEAKGFKVAVPYDPPHENQIKSLLEGARGQRQADGRTLVTDAKLQTFRENGASEMVVETPQCVHDPDARTVGSPGPLRVQTVDGQFSIEGEGFLWQQTNSDLIISNRVHTIVHPELLGTSSQEPRTRPAPPDASGLEIFSDHFAYTADSGQGIYQGNVRVAGTNVSLSSGIMTVLLPMTNRQLQSITATQKVIMDYEGVHATGERALYSADTGQIHVTGQPTWRSEHREGSGDELFIDRTNKIFRATGHAWLKMPGQSIGPSGFLSRKEPASPSAPAKTNQFVEIRCQQYEFRTNSAAFQDEVRLTERVGEQVQGKMSCSAMTATFAGTNELQTMTASNQVIIEQEDKRFAGERAFYNVTNDVLELSGNPSWQSGRREGKGDLIQVKALKDEMSVSGNASLRLPANELGRASTSAGTEPGAPRAVAGTNQFADIRSERYTVKPQEALFEGGVRIDHPRMQWNSGVMTVQSPGPNEKAQRILAEQAVVFDLLDEKGQKVHGTGEKAVYSYGVTPTATNEIVELTGNPVLTTTNGTVENPLIILDLGRNKLAAPGKYRIRGSAPRAGTNLFQFPKK